MAILRLEHQSVGVKILPALAVKDRADRQRVSHDLMLLRNWRELEKVTDNTYSEIGLLARLEDDIKHFGIEHRHLIDHQTVVVLFDLAAIFDERTSVIRTYRAVGVADAERGMHGWHIRPENRRGHTSSRRQQTPPRVERQCFTGQIGLPASCWPEDRTVPEALHWQTGQPRRRDLAGGQEVSFVRG